jgi:hypothetical protein
MNIWAPRKIKSEKKVFPDLAKFVLFNTVIFAIHCGRVEPFVLKGKALDTTQLPMLVGAAQ